eukprot:GFUD01085175.1.p1 GENE.GFUD01085175.1~~GFUD01085175.1.p1  ORF type:complete len:180 (-),score=35.64 GFUD01085175.1:65-604(-)
MARVLSTAGLLFCFLLLKLSEGGEIFEIFGEISSNKINHEVPESGAKPPDLTIIADNYSGFLPQGQSKGSAEKSCGCQNLILSSLGETKHSQPNSLGIYKYYQLWQGQPAYYGPGGSWLYSLAGGGWLVGPQLGSPTGFIHNTDRSPLCPYEIPGGWMYFNAHAGLWYVDTTLVLRCIS